MNGGALETAKGELIRLFILAGTSGKLSAMEEILAVEQPYRVIFDGKVFWEGTLTPGEERELVVGRLYSEGLICHLDDISSLILKPGQALVEILNGRHSLESAWRRRDAAWSPDQGIQLLPELMDQMQAEQRIFPETGSTHSAAVFDQDGRMLAVAEDVTRHNALDKAIGKAVVMNTVHRARIMTLTSRLSAELVRKASNSGIKLLAGISAATSQAVELAYERGVVLVGRVRGEFMQLYTSSCRLEERDSVAVTKK